MTRGLVSLVLHAHLPWVRRVDEPDSALSMESRWLPEAIVGCYLPLLAVLEGLERDRVPARLVVSVSATLAAMLDDDLLRRRSSAWLDSLVELADREVTRTRDDPRLAPLAGFYRRRFWSLRELWHRHDGRLLRAFAGLADRGRIELATATATHAFFPAMTADAGSIAAQVELAARAHADRFGRRPRGMWLGECGYVPGVENLLGEAGVSWFFVDAHALRLADEAPVHDVHAPVWCDGPVAAFARDEELSALVWDSRRGYPGDPVYRDFWRDIGFDLPEEDLAGWLPADGRRLATGIKYHAVTHRDLAGKKTWDPPAAARRAREHAAHFVAALRRQVDAAAPSPDRPPLVALPFDAELFGHWWFEGPGFLDAVLRAIAPATSGLEAVTPSDYLERFPTNQVATPSASSWGAGGYGEWWVNEATAWAWPQLHRAGRRLSRLVRRFARDERAPRRALAGAARELLLAQSSDWTFMIRAGTTAEYGARRIRAHLEAFSALCDGMESGRVEHGPVADPGHEHALFPDLDFRVFAREAAG